MPISIRPVRVNHMNAVVEDFDASVAHLQDVFSAEFLVDYPQQEWRAALIAMGDVIIELFVPYAFLLHTRYGPHYLGVEYQADMNDVRAAIAERGIRIVRDIGLAVHTHPADCFGVAFEFYDGSFHDRDWDLPGGKMKPVSYWREEHPLGMTGLKGYSIAVRDIDAASAFLQGFLSAKPVYEADRPAVAGRAIGLQVADAVVELIAPVADGAIEQHLRRSGEGIRSTIFGVRDIAQARSYFADRGVDLVAGDAAGRIAVPAAANLGMIFEFSE